MEQRLPCSDQQPNGNTESQQEDACQCQGQMFYAPGIRLQVRSSSFLAVDGIQYRAGELHPWVLLGKLKQIKHSLPLGQLSAAMGTDIQVLSELFLSFLCQFSIKVVKYFVFIKRAFICHLLSLLCSSKGPNISLSIMRPR
jgi:hypothetical protein